MHNKEKSEQFAWRPTRLGSQRQLKKFLKKTYKVDNHGGGFKKMGVARFSVGKMAKVAHFLDMKHFITHKRIGGKREPEDASLSPYFSMLFLKKFYFLLLIFIIFAVLGLRLCEEADRQRRVFF